MVGYKWKFDRFYPLRAVSVTSCTASSRSCSIPARDGARKNLPRPKSQLHLLLGRPHRRWIYNFHRWLRLKLRPREADEEAHEAEQEAVRGHEAHHLPLPLWSLELLQKLRWQWVRDGDRRRFLCAFLLLFLVEVRRLFILQQDAWFWTCKQ